jgi:hypothetical protein
MVVNEEISLYQEVSKQVKLRKVWDLLKATPHGGQLPVVDAFDTDQTVNHYVIVLGRRAQPLTSKVMTPDGWCSIANLKVGTKVSTVSGDIQTIEELHPIVLDRVYEVTIGDRIIRCNEEHLFTVVDHHGRTRTLPVKYLKDFYVAGRKNSHKIGEMTTEYKFKVLNPAPIYKSTKKLPIDPYVLGLLLGDGCLKHTAVLGMQDVEAIQYTVDNLKYGNIIEARPGYYKVNLGKVLNIPLMELGLLDTNSHTKFIPDEFLNGSIHQRIELLRGLLDTDGHVAGTNQRNMKAEYTTVSKRLADGVEEIVKSLGGNVTRSTKMGSYIKDGIKIECSTVYRLFISLQEINPFKITRKAKLWVSRKAPLYNYITKIVDTGLIEEQRCISVSSPDQLYISDNYTVTHNSGKSFSTAMIVLRELLIPYSNTILLTPAYRNSDIMFKEVLKHVQTLGLPVKSMNKGQFQLELENGAKFTSVTQTNYESALGSRLSLLVVDETQSIPDIKSIYEEILGPMFLDYGVKSNGTLYARAVFLGTPRGVGTAFHGFFLKELINHNWKSFNSPSTCNPLLPRVYLEQQQEILPDHVYRQEFLAEWITKGSGVFFAFDPELNLYDPSDFGFTDDATYIEGLDFGFTDSTAKLLVYIDRSGNYYVHDAYQQAARPTKEHVKSFLDLEKRNRGTLEARYGDPSAAQMIMDLRTEYDYEVEKANNKVAAGLACINDLLAPQGYDKKPKLYINKNLTELLRQIKSVTYKENGKNTVDPFNKDPEGSHWDLLAAMRYAIYTHFRRQQAGIAIV